MKVRVTAGLKCAGPSQQSTKPTVRATTRHTMGNVSVPCISCISAATADQNTSRNDATHSTINCIPNHACIKHRRKMRNNMKIC